MLYQRNFQAIESSMFKPMSWHASKWNILERFKNWTLSRLNFSLGDSAYIHGVYIVVTIALVGLCLLLLCLGYSNRHHLMQKSQNLKFTFHSANGYQSLGKEPEVKAEFVWFLNLKLSQVFELENSNCLSTYKISNSYYKLGAFQLLESLFWWTPTHGILLIQMCHIIRFFQLICNVVSIFCSKLVTSW